MRNLDLSDENMVNDFCDEHVKKSLARIYGINASEAAVNHACQVIIEERNKYELLDNMIFNREFYYDGKVYIISCKVKNE